MDKRLVFLHGFLGEPDDWREVIDSLPKNWHCLALDLNVGDPLLEAKTQLAGQTDFYLIGYSMGGRIAWQNATHLFSLKGLVLLGAHPGLNSKEEKNERETSDRKWIALLEQGDMENFLRLWYSQPLFASLRNKDAVIAKRMRRDPHALAKMMRRMSLAYQQRLTVTIPTLFLHGAEDLKYAELYSDQLQVEAIPEAGHAAHLENPHAVANAIRRFVENDHDHD